MDPRIAVKPKLNFHKENTDIHKLTISLADIIINM